MYVLSHVCAYVSVYSVCSFMQWILYRLYPGPHPRSWEMEQWIKHKKIHSSHEASPPLGERVNKLPNKQMSDSKDDTEK